MEYLFGSNHTFHNHTHHDNSTHHDNQSSHTSPILIIMAESFGSTIQIVAEVLIGVILSHPYLNMLSDRKFVRVLSKISIYVTLPLFLIQKIGSSVDISLLAEAWPALVAGLGMQILQAVVAELSFICMRCRSVKRTAMTMSVTWNNFATLPLVYVISLCKTGLFKDEKASEHATIFITLYYIPIQILFFSYGIWYLNMTKSDDEFNQVEDRRSVGDDLKDSVLNSEYVEIKSNEEVELDDEDEMGEEEENFNKEEGKNIPKIILSIFLRILWYFWVVVKAIVSVPIVAMLVGIILGCVPVFQKYLFLSPPLIVDSFQNFLTVFSDCYLGISLMITGANLGYLIFGSSEKKVANDGGTLVNVDEPILQSNNPEQKEEVLLNNMENDNLLDHRNSMMYKVEEEELEFRKKHIVIRMWKKCRIFRYNNGCLVFINCFLKLIVIPIICSLIILLVGYLVNKFDLFKNKSLLPILYLCILVESCTPLMLTLNMFAVMVQKCENEITELMFFQYLLAPFSSMIFSILFLYLVYYLNPSEVNIN